MTLNVTVPAFLGGISQQSDALRRNNFVEDAVNVEFIPSQGCTKRYPTEYVALLDAGSLAGYKVVTMERDDENYVVLIGDDDLKVFTVDGTAVTVKDPTAAGPGYTPDFSYLTVPTGTLSDTDVRTQQVADALFIANRQTTVASEAGRTRPSWVAPDSTGRSEAGVFIKQSNYGVRYTITIKTAGMSEPLSVSFKVSTTPFTYGEGHLGGNKSVSAGTFNGTVFPSISAGQAAGTAPFDMSANEGFLFNDVNELQLQRDPGGGYVDLNNYEFEADPITRQVYHKASTLSAGDTVRIGRVTVTLSYWLQTEIVARALIRRLKGLFDGSSADRPLIAIEGNTEDYDSETNGNSSFRISFTNAVTATDDYIEEFSITDSQGDTYSSGWTDTVENVSDLPTIFKHGAVVKVSGQNNDEADDYFLEFVSEKWVRDGSDPDTKQNFLDFGPGTWNETQERDLDTGKLTPSTMPHRLQRKVGDGVVHTLDELYFEYQAVDWDERQVGDETSNPDPGIVDEKIFDIFFHQNRLGFLAGNNAVFSEAGEILNFYRTTVLSLPDSELIDISVSGLEGNTLYSAVPFARSLLVTTTRAQAVLTSVGAFSPSTIEAPVISGFRSYATVRPVLQGRSVFFGFNTGNYAQVREFSPGAQDLENFSEALITIAVPKLVPNTVRKFQASAGDEALMVLTAEPDRLYLYQYLRSGGQLQMAAWGRWTFNGTLVDLDMVDDHAYMVMVRDGQTYLERLTFGAGRGDQSEAFVARIDRRAQVATGTYSIATDETSFTVPYDFNAADPMAVVADTGGTLTFGAPLPISSMDAPSNVLRVKGDYSAQPVFVGETYDSSITLARPLAKVDTQEGEAALTGGEQLVREFKAVLDDTGYMKATVTGVDVADSEEEFTAERFDTESLTAVRSGEFSIPIHMDIEEFQVVLSNDTPLPSTLVSGQWAIRYSNRYGTV